MKVSYRLKFTWIKFIAKFTLGAAFIVALSLSGCSSSSVSPAEGGDEAAVAPTPPVDAGTDAVPNASAESQTGPSEIAGASSAPTTSGQMIQRVVKRGDTLMKIAYEVYGDLYQWRQIYQANRDKISDPNSIPEGMTLNIEQPATTFSPNESGEKYLIKTGDTLGKISGSLYGTPGRWKELWEMNKTLIKNPDKIFAGFYLFYSGEGANSASSNAAPGAAAVAQAQTPSPDTAGAAALPDMSAQASALAEGAPAPADPNAGSPGVDASAPPADAPADPNAGAH